ncbi:MAG: helix-turn-helix domain-containing protein [Actinomycetota bacterium]
MPKHTAESDHRLAFGGALRSLRLQRGLSQEALADLAGLHRTYVGSVERGERNISLQNIYVLASALDVHPSAFFGESSSP